MDKLLIIDGSNLLFQMFFGMPSRIVNKDGKAIQGTLGFVGALLKIIRRTEPTHIIVIFDGEHENDRSKVDENYKANRIDYTQVDEGENPFSQLPDIYAALGYLKIVYLETTECEADDLIAGYALTYGNNTKIVISSFDSDFFQLISDNVSVLRYRGDKTYICNCEYIAEKLAINPSQYADFKSLTGDKADNIKGADRIGQKTAAQLLCEFGNLKNIIKNAEQIKKAAVRESVIRNSQQLQNNYKLIKLENVKLPFSITDLAYAYDGITTNEVLCQIGLK